MNRTAAQNWVINTTGPLMAVLFILGIAFSHTSQELFTQYSREDSFLEWLTFLTFLSTAVWLLIAGHTRRQQLNLPLWNWRNLGIVLVAAVFFLGAMEEVSWLQRILSIDSSDFFAAHNAQGETNLHNLKVGEVKINKLVFGKILAVVLLIHNVVLPLWARKKPELLAKVERYGLFLPPLKLVAIYFAIGLLISFIDHPRKGEVLEAAGAIHYSASAFLAYILGLGQRPALIEDGRTAMLAAMMFTGLVLFNMFIAVVLMGAVYNI